MTTTEEAEEMAEKLDVDARNMANGFNVNAIAAHHVAPAAAMLRDLAAERDRLNKSATEWRDNFRALEKAVVGDTGLSAMVVATQARKYRPLYEEAKAELDRLREALIECRDEIDRYIRQEYPGDHPVHAGYRNRDFDANPARVALKGDSHD